MGVVMALLVRGLAEMLRGEGSFIFHSGMQTHRRLRKALTGAAAVGVVMVVPVRGLAEMLEASFAEALCAVPKRPDRKLLAPSCCLTTWSLISICRGAAACSSTELTFHSIHD